MADSGSLNSSKISKDSQNAVFNTVSNTLSCSGGTCQKDNSKEPAWKYRYIVTFISLLVITFTTVCRTIMGVVIVAMVNNTAIIRKSKSKSESCPSLLTNSTADSLSHTTKQEGEFTWSPETQGYILGCLFFGVLFIPLLAGRFTERFGCKSFLAMSLLSLSVLTLLIPPFAFWSASAVITLQVLRGVSLGFPGTCVTILIANWSPKTERGFLYSIAHSGLTLGPFLGNVFAGYVSETIGWPYVFYLLGGATLLLTLCVICFVSESPKENSSISKAELNYILSQQESNLSKRRPKLPWRQMLTSVPLYALMFLQFGRFWTISQFALSHATFLGTILHFSIGKNGLLSSIPFLFAFITSVIATSISGYIEKKKIVSVDFLRKFWIFLSSLLYSLCLLGMCIVGCNRTLSVIFAILSMGLAGLGTPGYSSAIQDLSPNFAGTLFSISSSFAYTACIIMPLIVGYLTDEKQTLEQWNKVFFISIGVVMSSAAIFIFFGSAKIQPWNFVDGESIKKEEKKLEKEKIEKEKQEVTKF